MSFSRYRQFFPISSKDIYLNHAAVSPLSTKVLDAIHHVMDKRALGNIEVFPEFLAEKKRLKHNLATLIGAAPQNIAIIGNTSEGLNWFDIEIKFEVDGLEIDIVQIQRITRSKSRFVRLADGSFFRLNDHILEKLGFLKKISRKSTQKDKFELSKYHINILDEVLSFSSQVKMGTRIKNLIDQLNETKGIKAEETNPLFNGVLRPYQKNGLGWLLFLNKYQFGGCLADDMGLGKTVQALALLQKKKGVKNRPNLIIAPTSVLYNWQREIERFTPNLTLFVYSGKDRRRSVRVLKTFDILLTTYTLLWRERELFRNIDLIMLY